MKTALQRQRRRAISPIIATILVVAMTVVAAGVLYTYFTTTATRAQVTAQIQVSAALVVPNGSGAGTGTVTVTDSGSVALTGLTLSGTGFTFAAFNPAPSGTSPISPGGGTSTTFTGTSVTAGISYALTITATFANGATTSQVITVTAT